MTLSAERGGAAGGTFDDCIDVATLCRTPTRADLTALAIQSTALACVDFTALSASPSTAASCATADEARQSRPANKHLFDV